ncbi:cardiolipin synthase [Bombus fervidus]|uniref:cardiolipin synthase n=1 Tax=Bombus fervidus TaxID=203811 RepID=UPI003AB8E67C
MNQFMMLCFKQSTISSRHWLERCLRQYLMYHARVYSNGINNHKNYIDKKENISRRKALKLQILQDIKQTKRKVEVIIDKENIWTVPNILCMGRIVTSPYLSYLILSQDYQIALWLLIIAGFSDLADGWIARTWTSQASKLGTFLDPAADKLLVGTLFLSLAWVGLVPIPLTCLVIARDVALVSAVSYIRYQSLPPPKTLARYFDPTYATVQLAPTYISKINTAIQLSFVAGTLAAPIFHFVNHPALEIFCYVTAVTTLAGGVSYLISKNTYKFVRKKTSTKSSN